MKNYEFETVITVEATEIEKVTALPDRGELTVWKDDIAEKISSAISTAIGNENFTAKVKVQVFIHEKEGAN